MKNATPELKPLPELLTDEAAEQFLETADLSEYDLSVFKPMRFELQPKAERVNMRLPKSLLEEVRARASHEGIPYQRYIRRALEAALATPAPKPRRRKTG